MLLLFHLEKLLPSKLTIISSWLFLFFLAERVDDRNRTELWSTRNIKMIQKEVQGGHHQTPFLPSTGIFCRKSIVPATSTFFELTVDYYNILFRKITLIVLGHTVNCMVQQKSLLYSPKPVSVYITSVTQYDYTQYSTRTGYKYSVQYEYSYE